MESSFAAKIRIFVLAGLLFCCFCAILIQLWNVQVRRGETHRSQASRQAVRNIRIPPVRGSIFTSDGVLLAGNRVSYDVVFHLSEMRRPGVRGKTVKHILQQADRLADFLGKENTLTEEAVLRHMNRYPGLPLTVYSSIGRAELARAVEFSTEIQGMEISANPVRVYPNGQTAGHLLGFVGRDDPNSAADRAGFYYYIPDTIGRAGLELAFDSWDFEKGRAAVQPAAIQSTDDPEDPEAPEIRTRKSLLRGFPGKKLVVVDTRGFIRESIGEPIPAENGKDIVLTLNFRAQKIAENRLAGLRGAMIVMDAENGDILAMASTPSYDPALFVPRISRQEYRRLTHDPAKPLFNRAAQGMFSPGSVIKPLVALARLSDGVSATEKIECDGRTMIGRSPIRCWIGSPGHGEVDMYDAIAWSCNDFFIESGLSLGIDKLKNVFHSAGLGSRTGFDLAEAPGKLPSGNDRKKSRWTKFDTALVSIGQGDILVTPLQAVRYVAAIANGGTLWKPNILRNIVHEGRTVYTRKPERSGKLAGTPEMLHQIALGMRRAVEDPSGSAKRAATPIIDLYGKTGTAEVGSGPEKYKNTWFLGFGRVPSTGKLYAIAVLVEYGTSGGKTCAPLASGFFESFLME